MLKAAFAAFVACTALASATPALAQGACARADLQKIADAYLAAQKEGVPSKIPFSNWVQYSEQLDPSVSLFSGTLSKPQTIAWSHAVLDTGACQVFVEAIVTDPAHPQVLGVALTTGRGAVSAIDMIATDKDDWKFDAAGALAAAKAEQWGPVTGGDGREALRAAAAAYLDQLTASGPKATERRYLIDEDQGAVVVISTIGDFPDARVLRVEKGQVRHTHVLSVCKDGTCAFPAR